MDKNICDSTIQLTIIGGDTYENGIVNISCYFMIEALGFRKD
jgi:hypothetical protein